MPPARAEAATTTPPVPQYSPDFDRRSPDGKAAFAVRSQHFAAVGDSLIMCRFTTERGGYGVFSTTTMSEW